VTGAVVGPRDPAAEAARLELVADALSFPTSLAFDDAGTLFVAEAGLPFGGAPPGGRVWRLRPGGGRDLLADRLRPPVNGLVWHAGCLYASGGDVGSIRRIEPDGSQTVLLDQLPGPGNYHTNMVVFGPEGKLYFSQGAMTNTGIVGLDAYELGWLRRLPHPHDLPGYDITLTGHNITTPNPIAADQASQALTGAPHTSTSSSWPRATGSPAMTNPAGSCSVPTASGTTSSAWPTSRQWVRRPTSTSPSRRATRLSAVSTVSSESRLRQTKRPPGCPSAAASNSSARNSGSSTRTGAASSPGPRPQAGSGGDAAPGSRDQSHPGRPGAPRFA
jgi:hypothetical protein